MRGRVWRLEFWSLVVAMAAACGYLVLRNGKRPTPAHAETNPVTFPPLE